MIFYKGCRELLFKWSSFILLVFLLTQFGLPGTSHGQTRGPLRVCPGNPRYFSDASGAVVLLTGSHTWGDFQDNGTTDPPPVFDYPAYLNFLSAHKHNFFRLWNWENAKWANQIGSDYWIDPLPFARTGPGMALDGKPKFDVTRFDPVFFARMRQRIIAARERGIYVSIMLFNGWAIEKSKGKYNLNNPWRGHPFNHNNNINGIDGDTDGDDSGGEIHTLRVAAITRIQEAYVRKVIDTVADLDNVLYEISNESPSYSKDWEYHMINLIKSYEAKKPLQHPVGMTALWPGGTNADLFASPADWISPNKDTGNYFDDPQAADGSKVILSDTDHLCGWCGNRYWAWKTFARGLNPVFMDGYDGAAKGLGALGFDDPNRFEYISLRANLGYILSYAKRVNLRTMTPHGELASTKYCLADPGSEYLVYLPPRPSWRESFFGALLRTLFKETVAVDLSAASGTFDVEWFNPATGNVMSGEAITGGGSRDFTPPFKGDAVLYVALRRSSSQ